MSQETTPIFRCTWCGRDNGDDGKECAACANTSTLIDRTKRHSPHWSRRTMNTVECKVCDRVAHPNIQGRRTLCDPSKDEIG